MYVLEFAITVFLLAKMPDVYSSRSDESVIEATTYQKIVSEEVILI
jgi:hypothetical protein